MYTVRKKFRFEAAHILTSAYSAECVESIHGHSYVVEVFLRSKKLTEDGMVIDFKLLGEKMRIKMKEWDHKLIVSEFDKRDYVTNGNVLTVPFNPTAENMARHLFEYVKTWYPELVWKVRVHETDTGWAEYAEDM